MGGTHGHLGAGNIRGGTPPPNTYGGEPLSKFCLSLPHTLLKKSGPLGCFSRPPPPLLGMPTPPIWVPLHRER